MRLLRGNNALSLSTIEESRTENAQLSKMMVYFGVLQLLVVMAAPISGATALLALALALFVTMCVLGPMS